MRTTVLFAVLLALCLLTIPMIAIGHNIEPVATINTQPQVHSPVVPESAVIPAAADSAAGTGELQDIDTEEDYPEEEPVSAASIEDAASFRILDESTGQIHEVSLRDFVRGAVAAEMPAAFHSEALKAQAVAAHTFALHNRLVQRETPDPALKGADFSADPSNMKVYITEEKAREFYGGDADLYWNKICAAADSVLAYILEYEEEPIVAAYHAISSGRTEDASNVWIGSAPYLKSVESGGDLLAPGYESTVVLSAEEVRQTLLAAYPGLELADDPAAWFSEPQRSDSGYVANIGVGNIDIPGKDIRTLFDLRSHHFEVAEADGMFTFTAVGYGHGIGLSQYGADFLARQGMTFDEILAAYYTGAALVRTI